MVQKISGVSWTIKQGDWGMIKQGVIENSDGSIRNLSSTIVNIVIWNDVAGIGLPVGIILNKQIVVNDAAHGVVNWLITQTDTVLFSVGVYKAEFRLSDAITNDYLENTETFSFVVLESS